MAVTSALTTCSLRRNTGSRAPLSGTRSHLTSVFWAPTLSSSCTTMQVYDLAWSPTGEYIISGSTDNVARIFLVSEGNGISLLSHGQLYSLVLQGNAFPRLPNTIITSKALHGILSTNSLLPRVATVLCTSTASLPNQAHSKFMQWAKIRASLIITRAPPVRTVGQECSVENPLQVTPSPL
jgi:WD40 repeat protein